MLTFGEVDFHCGFSQLKTEDDFEGGVVALIFFIQKIIRFLAQLKFLTPLWQNWFSEVFFMGEKTILGILALWWCVCFKHCLYERHCFRGRCIAPLLVLPFALWSNFLTWNTDSYNWTKEWIFLDDGTIYNEYPNLFNVGLFCSVQSKSQLYITGIPI